MILIGELALWVALLMAAWAAMVSFAGGLQRRADLIASGERGVHATLAMLLLASLGLWSALVAHDLGLAHVASFTAANLPLVYTLAAFWGGPAGALLLFALLLSICAVAVQLAGRGRNRSSRPYVTGTLATALAFAVAVLCVGANPYARVEWGALDGRGMHPVLQSVGMVLHPPVLYAGLAATAVPFALAVAALLTRRLDGHWLATTRRWAAAGWLLLTIGILLGMRWAYARPDWDGEWTLDALGNGAVLPWLVNAALLHSLATRGRERGSRMWNVVLLLGVFPLALFSAFLARGGIISAAHSFAGSPVTAWFAGFLVLAAAACTYLLLTRLHLLVADDAPDAADDVPVSVDDVPVSGDDVPVAVDDVPVSVSDAADAADAPASRRRIGVTVAYAGILLALVALAGQTLREEHTLTLRAGATGELRDPFGRSWRLTSQGVSQYNELNRSVVAAAIEVARAGSSGAIVTSERRQYLDSRGTPTFAPATTAGFLGTLEQDVRVTLAEVGDDETVRLRVAFNPLVRWLWIGGLISVLGGIMLLAEAARPRHE